jgi:dTDP-4-dehydrorhamnose 3,5-epimerase-like enzyme
MIDGVMVKQLRVLPDERGRLMEILREDDEIPPHDNDIPYDWARKDG